MSKSKTSEGSIDRLSSEVCWSTGETFPASTTNLTFFFFAAGAVFSAVPVIVCTAAAGAAFFLVDFLVADWAALVAGMVLGSARASRHSGLRLMVSLKAKLHRRSRREVEPAAAASD